MRSQKTFWLMLEASPLLAWLPWCNTAPASVDSLVPSLVCVSSVPFPHHLEASWTGPQETRIETRIKSTASGSGEGC